MMFHFNLLCAGTTKSIIIIIIIITIYFYINFLFFFSDFLIKNAIDLENNLFVCLFLKKSKWIVLIGMKCF